MNDFYFRLIPGKFRDRAYRLHEFGFSQNAWDRQTTLELLSWCRGQQLGILGGETILFHIDPQEYAEHTCDDWYTKWQSEETWYEFVERSYHLAVDYLLQYPEPKKKLTVYAPDVVAEKEYLQLRKIEEHLQEGGAFDDLQTMIEPPYLSIMLADLRDAITQYFEGQMTLEAFLNWASYYSYYSKADINCIADQMKADLIDYAFGVILNLSPQVSIKLRSREEDLIQLLQYINGEIAFSGTLISLY